MIKALVFTENGLRFQNFHSEQEFDNFMQARNYTSLSFDVSENVWVDIYTRAGNPNSVNLAAYSRPANDSSSQFKAECVYEGVNYYQMLHELAATVEYWSTIHKTNAMKMAV